MPIKKNSLRWLILGFGLALCLTGNFLYWRNGFSPSLLWFWLYGLGLLGIFGFSRPYKKVSGYSKRDLLLTGAVAAAFAPIYLIGVHGVPRQVNTDEIAISSYARQIAQPPNTDLFGPSQYWGFPNFIFWLFGKSANLIGGVSLGNMRLLHALSGVLVIALCFLLFRQMLSTAGSLLAAAVVGLNHSLFFISRMAMRDNTALLFLLLALILLYYSWRLRHWGWSLLGGVAAGLTFYTYYPSRLTILIWFGFVTAYLLISKFRQQQRTFTLAAATLLGFLIITLPLLIAHYKSPANSHFPSQFLFTREGRKVQQEWTFAKDESTAYGTNIAHGLLSFNQPMYDQGNIYPHAGYGFVDAITGILIWLGIITIAIESIRRRQIGSADLLMLGGFLIIWLSYAFLITKAPNYTRLLIILPFIGYLAARAADGLYKLALPFFRRALLTRFVVFFILLFSVALSNAVIAKDFINAGNVKGDAFGDTIRFQEKHAQEKAVWLFAPLSANSYFYWGDEATWMSWLSFAKGSSQNVAIIPPGQSGSTSILIPDNYYGYLLTDRADWSALLDQTVYKQIGKTDLTPDGRLKVIKLAAN